MKAKQTDTIVGVDITELSNAKMIAGNEKKFSKIVHGNVVKQWVGIGWVEVGLADHRHASLPRVTEKGRYVK